MWYSNIYNVNFFLFCWNKIIFIWSCIIWYFTRNLEFSIYKTFNDHIYLTNNIDHQACIGTFGDNCSGGPCKEGYYGFGCQSKCNCSTQQECDRFTGCTNLTGESYLYI